MASKASGIPYPPRVPLARLPTPIEPLKRMSERFGVDLYVKRDDLTGLELTGNKVRKLEFVLADALQQKADTVLTCGGAQSNHSRATAVAAARLGLRSRLILRTQDPFKPPALEGNLLLDRLAGTDILWITPDQYKRRDEIFARETARLRLNGLKPYVIPEGASNALGAWGYIYAAAELKQGIGKLPHGSGRQTTIIHATGSGGTTAGLILGTKLLGLNARIVGINVCDDRDYFVRTIGEICEDCISRYGLDVSFSRERDIEIVDGYVGLGYALSRPEELSLLIEVASAEGLFLDPVYTGKAFFGMAQELRRDEKVFGDQIIFLHTGGIFGLLPKADELASLLR
ncbi:MAG: D-cysteine desulfhydrase family protein [Deltaproteobacteria bacterium]